MKTEYLLLFLELFKDEKSYDAIKKGKTSNIFGQDSFMNTFVHSANQFMPQ